MQITNKKKFLIEEPDDAPEATNASNSHTTEPNKKSLTNGAKAKIKSNINIIKKTYANKDKTFEDIIKAPIIKDILKGNTDADNLVAKHITEKISSGATQMFNLVLVRILEDTHKKLLDDKIINATDADIAQYQSSTLSSIGEACNSASEDITTNGELFRLFKTNIIDMIENDWKPWCKDNPEQAKQQYGVEAEDTTTTKDDTTTSAEDDSTEDDLFYTLKSKKENCKYKFDAYKDTSTGIIYVVVEVVDEKPEFKKITEVSNEFKKEGRAKREKARDARTKEENRKAADNNYAGLDNSITEEELKNLAELLLKSLYTYFTNPAAYLDDAETGEQFKQQLISGLFGGNYTNDKGQKVPPTSSTEAFNYWYDGCWYRTDPNVNGITDRGNRYMIEAYYIVNEKNHTIGAGVAPSVEAYNTALKDSRLADYGKIYSRVKIHILKNKLDEIWKKASALLMKSVPRKSGDLDSAEKKMRTSSRITDMKDVLINSTISSKVKTGYDETVFNWRVLTIDKTSNTSKLELLSVFCNEYDVSQLFSKDLNKVITIDNAEILSSQFFNKKYEKGAILEGLLAEGISLPTDIKIKSFDEICDELSNDSTGLNAINGMAHNLNMADKLDNIIIIETANKKYIPEYLDYEDCRQLDHFMEYQFIGETHPISVYLIYINSNAYIFMRDLNTLAEYLKLM